MSNLRGEREGGRERKRASELAGLTAFLSSAHPPRCKQIGFAFSIEYLYFIVFYSTYVSTNHLHYTIHKSQT